LINISEVTVVLASASPRRRELLKLIGIVHGVRPADADESYSAEEEPAAYAERLAREKAAIVTGVVRDSLVIGADTIVVIDGHLLGKPRDAEEAARMLKLLRGRTHIVMTAVAVSFQGKTVSGVEKVSVTFRDLSDSEVESYVDTGEPMDKAGAYGIQGYGATIVKRIEGDYFAVMGLSLVLLVALMAEVGVSYEFAR